MQHHREKHSYSISSYRQSIPLAAQLSVFILAACTSDNGSRTFHSSAEAAKAYHDYLSDVKQKDNLSCSIDSQGRRSLSTTQRLSLGSFHNLGCARPSASKLAWLSLARDLDNGSSNSKKGHLTPAGIVLPHTFPSCYDMRRCKIWPRLPTLSSDIYLIHKNLTLFS